ncbi:Aste57867_21397 [Aphanomyces stellatus]|uniref:Aste57867_21397 protein n=1 Tax=Aphanomyces stellatus TaxID=120398 RepID=A0A485LI40_9STRA|nr:hypothetical protein As57867_021328 [Aphanomyces stellatus]VFT98068.1 Aste57867_21397 [Aphanomyces stellatus]
MSVVPLVVADDGNNKGRAALRLASSTNGSSTKLLGSASPHHHDDDVNDTVVEPIDRDRGASRRHTANRPRLSLLRAALELDKNERTAAAAPPMLAGIGPTASVATRAAFAPSTSPESSPTTIVSSSPATVVRSSPTSIVSVFATATAQAKAGRRLKAKVNEQRRVRKLSVDTTIHKVKKVTRAMTMNRRDNRRGSIDAEQLDQELATLATDFTTKLARDHQAAVFVISIHSHAKVWWDAAVAVVTFYALVLVPMDLVFDLHTPFPHLLVAQAFLELVFVLDIVLVFRTSFFDVDTHDEVFDVHRIRREYLAGYFWIDAMSSLPTSVLGDEFRQSRWAYLRLLVLCRVFRLSTSPTFPEFMAWASRTFTSYVVRLVVVVISYLLLHHYIACSLYALICFEGDPTNNTTTLWEIPFHDDDTIALKYLGVLHKALDVTSGSDVMPSTSPERIFGAVMFTVGIVANACVVGICASVLEQMNHIEDERADRKEAIDTCLRASHAGDDLQKSVMEFYDSAHGHESAHHAGVIFRNMPEKLQMRLMVSLNESFLQKVPLFKAMTPDAVLALMQCVQETVAMTGDLIIRAGEEGRAFYMIKMGTVEVFHDAAGAAPVDGGGAQPRASATPRVTIKHMSAGQSFGEMSLLQDDGVASANVVATSFCVLLVLTRDVFDWIKAENDDVRRFWERARERQLATSDTVVSQATASAALVATSKQVVAQVGVVHHLAKRAMPRRMQAALRRLQLRRAAHRLVLVQRTFGKCDDDESDDVGSSSHKWHAAMGKIKANHVTALAHHMVRVLRGKPMAAVALEAVAQMSQVAAHDMVDATRVTERNMLYRARDFSW